MAGITIEGLTPSSIEPSDDGGAIRTYQIGEYLIRVRVTDATPYPWTEFVDAKGESIHMGGFVGWSSHDDGDHIGSPYWALLSAIYGLARIHENAGGLVRWDDPRGSDMMDWDHVILSRFKSLEKNNNKWDRVTDPRDDAICSPLGRIRHTKQLLTGDEKIDEVYPLPNGCDHVWPYEGRWICE